MNVFDFILLLAPIYFCYKGIRKGFVNRVLAILSLFIGAFISYYFHDEVTRFMSSFWESKAVEYLAYIIPFVLVILVAKLIASIITKGLKVMALSPLNIFLGALFGIIQGCLFSIVLTIITMVINSFIETPIKRLSDNSLLYKHIVDYISPLLDALSISV